ncbi:MULTISPECIES: MvdC family ATP-grasp ribosomal peptide maturase [unclassified Nodularia (in: cyanobacteria)]|uniref:MvdC family ATP-grasp ribosomal peptide maturase n=1 Tax=unclassified Nodularia (in: cyanobacteria) TaxID=2656917 RepID=UPI0018815D15|nr:MULTISPECIES: MvdC family ATP-grasp ribosomal peptide maturase [unclassified Nodularia (in: cyanobacteria)]MBE9197603.1 MvdC family ATP-grasp ribosomal peptide maturase [Nodularia sp. LEGE 06071]MCC2692108.1 MvdC family ATP-grasp ribosomal peptide maturase [Nodularia sp. LEGE 04288]
MHPKRDVVLLITHSGDYFTIDRVAAALSNRNVQAFRLDTDQFPMTIKLQAYFHQSSTNHQVEYGDIAFNTEEVQAVWMRRLWQPHLSEELAPQYRAACARESLAVLDGFWDSLRHAHWVDDLQKINAAENKLYQLRVAAEVGLVIPQTLVTNNPKEAREFFQQVKGKMITKLLKPLSYGMEGSSFFMYTSTVKEEDLLDAETLRYCPMVFQAQIPKQQELRAVYVNGNLFVGALDASSYAASAQDWRHAPQGACVWQPYELPEPMIRRLDQFMARLGLTFGALDLIVTPSGEYVFLEINPTGEWGMLERDLNYPISQAIADALLEGKKLS